MMSLETIRSLSARQARRSRQAGVLPLLFEKEDLEAAFRHAALRVVDPHVRAIPNIGNRTPRGYRKVRDLFVDKTGLGFDWEPALTVWRFIRELRPGHAYAITVEGEFQCTITEFLPPNRHQGPRSCSPNGHRGTVRSPDDPIAGSWSLRTPRERRHTW